MIQTIRVKSTQKIDPIGTTLLSAIKHQLKIKGITKIDTARIYRLEGITQEQATLLADKLLYESINQISTLNKPLLKAKEIIEVAYKPGVMNPEVASLIKAGQNLGIQLVAADVSTEYGFSGRITNKQLTNIFSTLHLYNPLTAYIVKTPPKTLLIQGAVGKTTTIKIRTMTDEALAALSKDKLFLDLSEMKVIQIYFQKIKRDPTDIELETLAQTWSEHCAHKTFKATLSVEGQQKEPLMTRIKNEALKHKTHIVSAFVDNAGAMDFYDGYALSGKAETHNSPSAIEPYGGAMTGSGGVFRDVVATGQGAKVIASTDIFCLAHPDMDHKLLPPGCLPPDYILKEVIRGVKDYGNRMGIPTNNGSLHFHNDFRARPTILVGAYGILPKKRAKKGKAVLGDIIVVVGGKTGRDGIHGATFSSGEMTDRTKSVNASAVQIGNAIEEKRVFDALLEARDKNLIHALQDCGAGGFSSAIGELGEYLGAQVNLEKVAIKYPGLFPWEIWVSESQERMVLALAKSSLDVFLQICKKYNVEAIALGTFDGKKKLQIFYEKEKIADLDMQFLHHGLPQRNMIATRPLAYTIKPEKEPKTPPSQTAWIKLLKNVLSHGSVASKEPILRLYDHSVQGTNVLQPFSGEQLDGPNDAVVIKPFYDLPYGMVLSHGLNPVLNTIDPFGGSLWAGVEALANYVSVGGNYKDASLINNYVWPFPDEESLWSLDKSVDAVVLLMKTFGIPVISGKDSLSSTYRSTDGTVIKIPPTLCISVFGKIPDVTKTMSSDFKKTGSVICLIGQLDFKSLGGSIYFDTMGLKGETIPQVDLKIIPQVFDTITSAIQSEKILSCHDISEGGMITTLFEMCVGGNMGATISLDVIAIRQLAEKQSRPDQILFNETAGSFLIEIEDEKTTAKLLKNIPYVVLGKTQKDFSLKVLQNKKTLFDTPIEPLKKAWQEPMRKFFT